MLDVRCWMLDVRCWMLDVPRTPPRRRIDFATRFAYKTPMTTPAPVAQEPHLRRRLGLLQATALNMSNMVGVGPFITIPLLMGTINGGGPQAMLGWIVGLLIA